jgi:4'-phosphopantetheinyl transferase
VSERVPAEGEIEISFARPEALDDPLRREAALALLSGEERERLRRFHFERDRRLHLAARALLRRSLSRWAAVLPDAWRFETNERGRPEIRAPASPLRFNVSHTRGLAMVAVAEGREVGVDAERVPDAVPFEVVERSFASGERAAVLAAPAREREARFAEIWVLKEAYAKARGLGLALAFDEFAFELAPPRLVRGEDGAGWHFELMMPTAEHRAALCVRVDHRPLRVVVRWDDG